tara:strand:- start:1610 stop:1735 length:126 start_codon:yes stop_codon:yes gene_type:complete
MYFYACKKSIFGHNGTELKEECQGHDLNKRQPGLQPSALPG